MARLRVQVANSQRTFRWIIYNGGYTTWNMSPSTGAAFSLGGYGSLFVGGIIAASGVKTFTIEHPHPLIKSWKSLENLFLVPLFLDLILPLLFF